MPMDAASGLGLDCAGARALHCTGNCTALALAADSGQVTAHWKAPQQRSSDRMLWLASKAARSLL